jgi:hypothetical protein
VNLSGRPKVDDKSRKMIRTHVMRNHLHQERVRRPVNPGCRMKEDASHMLHWIGGGACPCVAEGPFWPPGGQKWSGMDPFAQFPVKMMPHMYQLVYQC